MQVARKTTPNECLCCCLSSGYLKRRLSTVLYVSFTKVKASHDVSSLPLSGSPSWLCHSLPPLAYFTELHGHSERSLQDVLSPLGSLYSQNTRLYGDLYTDLRRYYRGSALNLDENLSDFWSRLLERTFKTSTPTDVSKDTY